MFDVKGKNSLAIFCYSRQIGRHVSYCFLSRETAKSGSESDIFIVISSTLHRVNNSVLLKQLAWQWIYTSFTAVVYSISSSKILPL